MKKTLVIGFGIFLCGINSFAGTIIYQCSPFNDDGDAFGETIVLGFDMNSDQKLLKLNLISEYFGQTASVASPGSNYTFDSFSTPSGDPLREYSEGLTVKFVDLDLASYPVTLSPELSIHNFRGTSAVIYTCNRISQ